MNDQLIECVIGIDPGYSSKSGLSAVTISNNPILLKTIAVQTEPTLISKLMHELSAKFIIKLVAIEDQYLQNNVATLQKLARAGAFWEFAAKQIGLRSAYVSPKTWQSKELCGATGNASRRDQIKKASIMKAKILWKVELSDHQSDSALLARYVALELFYGKIISDEYREASRRIHKSRKRIN